MDLDPSVLWDFAGEIVGTFTARAGGTRATVTRIDNDGTVWAQTAGGTEAPASSVGAGVEVGDEVELAWDGARMSVATNVSNPPASGRAARAGIASSREAADKARAIAEATGQHFFADDNGVHVSTEDGNPTGTQNILMNALGMLIRKGKVWRAAFTETATSFYDGLGNTAANVIAQFGADGAIIGYTSGVHVRLKNWYGMRLYDAANLLGSIGKDLYGRFGVHGQGAAYVDAGNTSLLEVREHRASVSTYAETEEEGVFSRAGVIFTAGPLPNVTPRIELGVVGDTGDFDTNSLVMDSKQITSTGRIIGKNQTRLWSGGYYMDAGHTATLSEHVRDQPNGIVLVWSAYVNGAAQNYDWNFVFIPKDWVANYNGNGLSCVMARAGLAAIAVKYVTITENFATNTTITGDSRNVASGTACGINYNNTAFVLREVWGV